MIDSLENKETLLEVVNGYHPEYDTISFYDQLVLKNRAFDLYSYKTIIVKHLPSNRFYAIISNEAKTIILEVAKSGSVKTNLIFTEI